MVLMVEEYVNAEIRDCNKHENRTPLDDTGVWLLHRLAGEIYAQGFEAGVRIAAERSSGERRRERERAEA